MTGDSRLEYRMVVMVMNRLIDYAAHLGHWLDLREIRSCANIAFA